VLIFDEFHNALRGRARDVEAIFAFLRRLGRSYDVSPVLVGEVAVDDYVNATDEMASRFELCAVPRWRYGGDYLALLDIFLRPRCRLKNRRICPTSRRRDGFLRCPRG